MTIAARVSDTEVDAIIRARFQDKYLEGRLINAPGLTYTPGTTDQATFLGNEVLEGTGGYKRQLIGYVAGDFATYTDGGVGLQQKATVFTHNGSGTVLNFTHVALIWSQGQVLSLEGPADNAAIPTSWATGTYEDVPVIGGSGQDLTVDVVVINNGVSSTDYTITVASPGRDYVDGETLQIPNGTILGLDPTAGTGDLTFSISSTGGVLANADAGNICAVAKTTNAVALTGGNQAVFYWNLKQFGFYSL